MRAAQTNRYHRVPGLDATASSDDLKCAYRDLVQVWHPDRFTANPRLQKVAQEKLRKINAAYEALHCSAPAAAPLPASPTPPAPRIQRDWLFLTAQGLGVAAAIFALIMSARSFYSYLSAKPAPALFTFAAVPGEVSDPETIDDPPAPRHRPANPARTTAIETLISNGYEIITPRGRPGVGKVSVSNQTGQDAVASLLQSDSGAALRTVYISAGMEAAIERHRSQSLPLVSSLRLRVELEGGRLYAGPHGAAVGGPLRLHAGADCGPGAGRSGQYRATARCDGGFGDVARRNVSDPANCLL